jgi:RNA-binding protein
MAISKLKIRELRSQAHALNPVVMLGNKGYTEAVQAEIERALFDHELIKIRLSGLERPERKQLIEQICQLHKASLIQALGHTVTLYRANVS